LFSGEIKFLFVMLALMSWGELA